MRASFLLLLLIAAPAAAQDSAFDDFDDEWESEGPAWSGFVEPSLGARLHAHTGFASRQTLGDLRVRLETEWSNETLRLTFKGEGYYDDYEDELSSELRDLSVQLSPGNALDLKFGRQVLTWGTGDLLFLNDVFPKSWVSFFAGRDDEYLKAPSDAARLTWYGKQVNVDVVWLPEFEPDDYLTGRRFSFFSPEAGNIVVPEPPLSAKKPGGGIDRSELAIRLFKTVGASEYAVYLYRGFFKRPVGLDSDLNPKFPALSVYGSSMRRPLAGGLFNAEFAYYDSREDPRGRDPLVPNDQFRLLVGYEFEAAARFNVGLQYYLERTQNYGALIGSSPTPEFEPDRSRHVLTNRLTYRTGRDRLTLSLFTFYSPSDHDYYLRPTVSFRHSDRWSFTGGWNLFGGDRPHTFFGQLEDNSNAYFRARFSF